MPAPTARRFNPYLARLGRALDLLYPLLRLAHQVQDRVSLGHPPRRILVFESGLIGDMVLLAPLLNSLRTRFPDASIEVLGNAWLKDVLGPTGLVDRFECHRIPWSMYDHSLHNLASFRRKIKELRTRGYDLAIDPRGDARNALVLWLIGAPRRVGFGCTGGVRYLTDLGPSPAPGVHLLYTKHAVLAPLGIDAKPDLPRLTPSEDAESAIQPFLASLTSREPLFGFHPSASQAQRRLDPGQSTRLLTAMARLGATPILIGGPSDRPNLEAVANHSGIRDVPIFTGPLPHLMALMSHLKVMVGTNSGPAHLSSALGTPTVVLSGTDTIGFTAPFGAHVRTVSPEQGQSLHDLHESAIIAAIEQLIR